MKLEFSSNLSLNKDDSERYQFIYATQVYATLYGVYGRFNTILNDDEAVIQSIDLIGINYKGPVTLNIYPKFDKPSYAEDKETGLKMLEMNLYLQAGKSDLQNIDPYVINFKELFPEESFSLKKGDYLKVQRKLVPMITDNALPVKDRAFNNGQFDSEFYERDGLFVKERPSDYYEMNDSDLIFNNVKENPFDEGSSESRSLGTIRCTPGISKIHI